MFKLAWHYNKNTYSRVVTPQFGGTEHLRPSDFPGYILANTNPVDMANQKSQIMHNFNHKCITRYRNVS